MSRFHDYFGTSVRRRLMLMVMLTVTAVLALVTSAFLVSDAVTSRRILSEELKTLVQVVGANSTAALSFNDRRIAEENIFALRAGPDIRFAGLFTANGELFSSYVHAAADSGGALMELQNYYELARTGKQPEAPGILTREYWTEVVVTSPVILDGTQIGTIVVEASFARLYEGMLRSLLIAAAVFVVAMSIALLLSARLQRTVSGPVLELADAMRSITATGTYGIRVTERGRDEIGSLFSAFNHMLEQIGLRDRRVAAVTERLNLALEVTGLALWDWDIVRDRLYLGERWAEITGAPRGETETTLRGLAQGLHPDDRRRVEQRLGDTLAGRAETYDVEYRYRARSGTWIWLHNRGRVMARNADGRATRMIGTMADITRRKNAEAELQDAKAAAEQASRVKSQFLANMSHEIRTPMNGVLGMTELLLATALDDRQRQLAETARQSGKMLLQIINDILDFSRIEAGRLELETISFDPKRVLNDMIGLFAEAARAKDIQLSLSVAEAIPPVLRGDPGRLRQILTNLVGNAIKFTDRGAVDVRAELADEQGDRVLLRFEVRDTGIGIDPGAQVRIFDAFSQADSSTTRKYGGSGLGLAISRELVALFGGQMGVSSQHGGGSVFWFTLPLERQQGTEPDALARLEWLRKLRVLVVDDYRADRDMLCDQLTALGMRADGAVDGQEALNVMLAALGLDPYRLTVFDMQMPGMDGLEFARRIRQDARLEEVELVIVGSPDHDMPDKILRELRVRGPLTKPVSQKQLSDCLLNIPRAAAVPPAVIGEPATAPVQSGAGAHVLVVEDNPVNQAVATAMLARLGYTCEAAANGREALEAIAQRRFGVVLMDCQMPVMDGFEATKALRAREAAAGAPRMPVIAVTAHAIEGAREQCVAAGMDSYISKPFDLQRLGAAIGQYLDRRQKEGTRASAPVPGPGDEAVDRSVLDGIRALEGGGGSALLHRVVRIFLETAPQMVNAIRSASDAGNLDALDSAAHSLKSSCFNVGAVKLAALCHEIETAARAKPPTCSATAIAAIEPEYLRVEVLLRAELGNGR